MLISCAMFFDALKPLSILSLVLQGNEVDIVMSIESTVNSLKTLMLLLEKEPCQWPTVKLIKTRIKDIDGVMEYQGIPVGNFDECVQQCSIHVLADLHRVEENIKDRLEWSDLKLLRSILVFLETQHWIQRESGGESDGNGDSDNGLTEIRSAVDLIVSSFLAPLEAKGMNSVSVQGEIEEAVEYARTYLSLAAESYRQIWYKLHTCPNSGRWPNILLLCELVFSLPFTTCHVEQMFSLLRVVKTKCRTNLQTSTLQNQH